MRVPNPPASITTFIAPRKARFLRDGCCKCRLVQGFWIAFTINNPEKIWDVTLEVSNAFVEVLFVLIVHHVIPLGIWVLVFGVKLSIRMLDQPFLNATFDGSICNTHIGGPDAVLWVM